MTPIQQLMLGVGVSKKTYLDDLFSTYVYKGTGSNRSINNGINLSGEGGLTFIKRRDSTNGWQWTDTVRGATKWITSHGNDAESTNSNGLTAFNNNGFTLGNDGGYNGVNDDYASWSFRKTPGFFDVVTFNTGSTLSSNLRISHSLGCVPGMILIKNLEDSEHWYVYHRDTGNQGVLHLNQEDAVDLESFTVFDPTATDFGFNTSQMTSTNKDTVAYLFAGGESTAATARSVTFDGGSTNNYLAFPSALATSGTDSNPFCIETWVYFDEDSANEVFFSQYDGTSGRCWLAMDENKIEFWQAGDGTSLNTGSGSVQKDQWYHVAWTYDGTNHRLFLDGTLKATLAGSSINSITTGNPRLGNIDAGGYDFAGKLSNFRCVQGQAVYTASFRPSTIPLTTTSQGVTASNCKVLCCNNSNMLNNDGTFEALTNPNSGSSAASTDSPFDDPAGFVFGENEDQNVIKCGSYKGNDSSDGPEINLGWEPQYVMIKNSGTASTPWQIFDSIRGVVTGDNDIYLRANTNSSEYTGHERISFTPTGFKIDANSSYVNESNKKIIYMAIRRPDGYCGKPAEAGTDVFAIDRGNSSSTIPLFDSGFPVDFGMIKNSTGTDEWWQGSRLTQGNYLESSRDVAEGPWAIWKFDSNEGFAYHSSYGTNYIGWMWKRHAGFDVVTYTGDGVSGKQIPHSLNAVPEMIWVKNRDEGGENWGVYHKGLNGGSSPEDYLLKLNLTDAESDAASMWNDTAPTATHFTLGNSAYGNSNTRAHIAMLFASVDGISKCGSWTGLGTSAGNEIDVNLGFSPRFIIIKRTDNSDLGSWYTYDTTRGLTTLGSASKRLQLDDSDAEATCNSCLEPTSTGFTIGLSARHNTSSAKYIYYAHA